MIPNWGVRQIIFDSASPRTADTHDTIVLRQAHPSGYQFIRVGADLLICSTSYWQEILIVRHFCMDNEDKRPWNNQIEEITFSHAGEIWLADDIYDQLELGKIFPSANRINKKYRLKKFAEHAAKVWRVRPFRDVLPLKWFASASCSKNLAKVPPKQ